MICTSLAAAAAASKRRHSLTADSSSATLAEPRRCAVDCAVDCVLYANYMLMIFLTSRALAAMETVISSTLSTFAAAAYLLESRRIAESEAWVGSILYLEIK